MRSQPLDAGVDSAKLGEAETTTEYAYVSVLFISRYEGTALYRNRSECATEASIYCNSLIDPCRANDRGHPGKPWGTIFC